MICQLEEIRFQNQTSYPRVVAQHASRILHKFQFTEAVNIDIKDLKLTELPRLEINSASPNLWFDAA